MPWSTWHFGPKPTLALSSDAAPQLHGSGHPRIMQHRGGGEGLTGAPFCHSNAASQTTNVVGSCRSGTARQVHLVSPYRKFGILAACARRTEIAATAENRSLLRGVETGHSVMLLRGFDKKGTSRGPSGRSTSSEMITVRNPSRCHCVSARTALTEYQSASAVVSSTIAMPDL